MNAGVQTFCTHAVSARDDDELIVFAGRHGGLNLGHGLLKWQHTSGTGQLRATFGRNLIFHVNGGHAGGFKFFDGSADTHHIAIACVCIADHWQIDTRCDAPCMAGHERQIDQAHIGPAQQ